MPESMFDIIGNHLTRQAMKNVTRQPMSTNFENMGKTVSSGPVKLNEPSKKIGEPKKSFLSNTGKALQSTPCRQVFTPRAVNVGAMIYTDDKAENEKEKEYNIEDIMFTNPPPRRNAYLDSFDFLEPEVEIAPEVTPPSTPPPQVNCSMELNSSYDDDFFSDDFYSGLHMRNSDDSGLGLPELY